MYNGCVLRLALAAILALAAASAQTAFFPLKDIRPGMRGIGRTAFSGAQIDEFQVEILGVMDNAGPKQSIILARLSGGPLEHTGVLEGMSGSPVYLDGKLAGAVAMAFPYAKDPIAGIRPIEEMVRAAGSNAPAPAARAALGDSDILHLFPKPVSAMAGEERMVNVATPLSFAGFNRETVEVFGPQLRALGLEPRQGVAGGGDIAPGLGNPASLKPGSMISVQLMSGDLSVGADGTLTYIDGDRVYAFGHSFLGVGATALPFARSDVVTLLPALNASFKVSSPKEWMGAITQDRDTAVSGTLGKLPAMVPMSIRVTRAGRPIETYHVRMVNDPLLTPLLIQMAVASTIDATERTVGAASVQIGGEIQFQNGIAPLKISSVASADNGSAAQSAMAAAMPAAFAMQSGFHALEVKQVDLNVDASDVKRELQIDGVTASRRVAHPGDTIRIDVSLVGEDGREIARQVEYRAPVGAEPGTIYFTVADAATTNMADFHQVLNTPERTPEQVIAMLNALHPNNKAYVRVWSASPAFELEGADLPAPPASVALILGGLQMSAGGITQTRNSRIAEMEIDAGGMAVTGSKTIQVEIKE
jgi:hypothetical protein